MTIDEPISVGIVNDIPKYMLWKGRNYRIDKIGLHHTFRKGEVYYHVFSATSGTLFLSLSLDTKSLHWRLKEVSDAV